MTQETPMTPVVPITMRATDHLSDSLSANGVFSPEAPIRQNLLGPSLVELEARVVSLGLPKFRARQVWRWVWRHGLTSFDEMTDLGKDVRQHLAAHFVADRPVVTQRLQSVDGTIKWLLRFVDGQEAEAVYIPDHDRGTLCVSSQVGCTLTCSFCHTGTQKLVRNLTVAEICGQVLLAMDEIGDWPAGNRSLALLLVLCIFAGEAYRAQPRERTAHGRSAGERAVLEEQFEKRDGTPRSDRGLDGHADWLHPRCGDHAA